MNMMSKERRLAAAVPLAAQDRLLSAIERGETRRLGAAEVRHFDVHVLAATTRNLSAEVSARRFRRDLFDRVNMLRLEVPPIRERRDDVPLLVASLLQEWTTVMRRQLSGLTIAAERAVLSTLEAGCHAPVAAHAALSGDDLRIHAVAYALDGLRRVGLDRTVPLLPGYARTPGSGNGADAADDANPIVRAARAGTDVARRLLERGAADIVPRESTP